VKLTGSNVAAGTLHGTSCAMSADGNTLAFGAPGEATGNGAVYVFVYDTDNETWGEEATFLPTDIIDTVAVQFGANMSISGDGNTLAIATPTDNTTIGACWIYTRSAGVWTNSQKLLGTAGDSYSGAPGSQSVSLSADGEWLAVGCPGRTLGIGGVHVYFKNEAGVFTSNQVYQGAPPESPPVALEAQGTSVAFSADGRVLISSAPNQDTDVGGFYVFERSVISSQLTYVQTSYGPVTSKTLLARNIGQTISVTGDGKTVVAGLNRGGMLRFTQLGKHHDWVEVPSILKGADIPNTATTDKTSAIVISSKGPFVAVGSKDKTTSKGALYLFA